MAYAKIVLDFSNVQYISSMMLAKLASLERQVDDRQGQAQALRAGADPHGHVPDRSFRSCVCHLRQRRTRHCKSSDDADSRAHRVEVPGRATTIPLPLYERSRVRPFSKEIRGSCLNGTTSVPRLTIDGTAKASLGVAPAAASDLDAAVVRLERNLREERR